MKKIVLDFQSDIHAHTMERMLMQKLDDCHVVISESPDATAEWCKTHRKGTAGKARGSDRRFSLRLGVRKLLCFGDRQRLNHKVMDNSTERSIQDGGLGFGPNRE